MKKRLLHFGNLKRFLSRRGYAPPQPAEPCESANEQGKYKGRGGACVRVGAGTPQEWEQPRQRMHNGERSGRR